MCLMRGHQWRNSALLCAEHNTWCVCACACVCRQVLEELVSKLLVQMPLLLRLLDHIALLDMLLAFFQAVTGR